MGNRRTDTPSRLLKKLTRVFNEYIRRRDTDFRGYGACISCRITYPYEKLDAGHYWTTKDSAIRFDERNVHAQCIKCNRFLEGNKPAYTLSLVKKYGSEILDQLDEVRSQVTKWRVTDLREKIKEYEKKLKEVKNK